MAKTISLDPNRKRKAGRPKLKFSSTWERIEYELHLMLYDIEDVNGESVRYNGNLNTLKHHIIKIGNLIEQMEEGRRV